MKVMDHTAYPKSLKTKSEFELRSIIADCHEVIELQKDFNPNIGYYEDEIHYCAMEITRRRKAAK
jgi:hypothetical protein